MFKRKILPLFLLSFLGFFFFFNSPVFAKKTIGDAGSYLQTSVAPTGISQESLSSRIGTIVKGILGAVGLVFFVLMFYGGFLWMTAHGNEDQVGNAKETIIAAVIGLVVIVASYGLTNVILTRMLSEGPNGPNLPGQGNVGNEALGCCADKVSDAAWACRPATQAECKSVGQQESLGDNNAVDWKWTDGYSFESCESMCAQLNQ